MNQQRAKIGREEFEKGNREMEEFMRSVRDKSHSSGGLTISSITTETFDLTLNHLLPGNSGSGH